MNTIDNFRIEISFISLVLMGLAVSDVLIFAILASISSGITAMLYARDGNFYTTKIKGILVLLWTGSTILSIINLITLL